MIPLLFILASCLSDPKDTSDSLTRFDNVNFYEGVLEQPGSHYVPDVKVDHDCAAQQRKVRVRQAARAPR